ncbi:hypothetical protein [Gilvimarinus sp. DA14]|uniref:hypothetical protein n=1 Tax=Gilvimarinus sp. DA14 TaxID=2956798 RepID=UPI0020B87B04|nr:hypothetical protein [Gilvimarinus sp. DA14]UTF59137.1 hypothetical protein NHM04_11695 [Gilvimarinus sp. DA14]
MVEEKDIELFLKAKKEEKTTIFLQSLSAAFLLALVMLEVFNVTHDYTILLATISIVFMTAALGRSRWITVSRSHLIATLESIINRDANALKILADKKRS